MKINPVANQLLVCAMKRRHVAGEIETLDTYKDGKADLFEVIAMGEHVPNPDFPLPPPCKVGDFVQITARGLVFEDGLGRPMLIVHQGFVAAVVTAIAKEEWEPRNMAIEAREAAAAQSSGLLIPGPKPIVHPN